MIVARGVHASLHSRSAAGKNHDDVLADFGEISLAAGAETFTEANEKQERTDSPGDSEHGEERTQFMRPEGAEDLRDYVDDELH